MGIAQRLGRLAGHKIGYSLIGEPGDLTVEKRNIDMLSFAGSVAGFHCGENSNGRIHAAHNISNANADFHGASALRAPFTCDAHNAAHALDEEVIARAASIGP